MNLTELRQHHLYKLLPEKEKQFIEQFLITEGDADASYRHAFGAELDLRIVRRQANKLMTRPDMASLIEWICFDEEPTEEQVRRIVWKEARTSKSESVKASLYNLYTELRGMKKKDAKPKQPQTAATPIEDPNKELTDLLKDLKD